MTDCTDIEMSETEGGLLTAIPGLVVDLYCQLVATAVAIEEVTGPSASPTVR